MRIREKDMGGGVSYGWGKCSRPSASPTNKCANQCKYVFLEPIRNQKRRVAGEMAHIIGAESKPSPHNLAEYLSHQVML